LKIAGISTREVRERNERIGFKITDLSSNKEGWLARISEGGGPRVGRYFVASKDLEEIGVGALSRAVEEDARLIIVDEIGPMEMTDPAFRIAVSKILEAGRMVVATVKYGSHYPEVEQVQGEVVRLEVAKNNREAVYRRAISQLDYWVDKLGS
jgi:nucleoside-triphosphatase